MHFVFFRMQLVYLDCTAIQGFHPLKPHTGAVFRPRLAEFLHERIKGEVRAAIIEATSSPSSGYSVVNIQAALPPPLLSNSNNYLTSHMASLDIWWSSCEQVALDSVIWSRNSRDD